MSKILVTGGAGFIGSNLCKRLVELEHEVYVIDDFSTGSWANLPDGIAVRELDISKVSPYPIIMTWEPDYVFHLAALARIQPSFENPEKTHRVNSVGTFRILDAVRDLGTAKLIYAGTSSCYHDVYANPYTYSKWLGEEHCRFYSKVFGVQTSIARFFNVYGPNQILEGPYACVVGIFLRQKAEGKRLTITGTGEQRRDFTHVEDIVNGLIAMMKGPKWDAPIYNFGSGRNHSILEVAQLFDHPYEFIPARPGEAPETLADIAVTTEQLGWRPAHRLEEDIKLDLIISRYCQRAERRV